MHIILQLKTKIIAFKHSNNRFLQFIFWGSLMVKHVFQFIISSAYREQSWSKIRYRKQFHQPSHYTAADRYPDLFDICSNFFTETEAPVILSFGCATGEEVFSLGNYLPNAVIIGTDLSHWCVKECRKKDPDKKYLFLHSKSTAFEQVTNLDAIFCLAVFQHYDNRENAVSTSTKYLFSQFEAQLLMLDKKLKPGGTLYIDHCDFDFMETTLALNYYPLPVTNNKLLRERPLFNKYNLKVGDTTENYRIFVKSTA